MERETVRVREARVKGGILTRGGILAEVVSGEEGRMGW